MTHHIQSTIRAVLVIVLATTALSKAEESEAVTRLKAEKAALEKRLTEINAEIEKRSMTRGDDVLGMTLADPTEELRKK